MNGSKVLADTNTFIALLSKHPAIEPVLNSDWWYSFITEVELLGKFEIKVEETKVLTELLGICTKAPHSEDIDRLTISIKQKYKVKTPDAFIAATALYHNIPLLTFDKGFKKVKELDLILLDWN